MGYNLTSKRGFAIAASTADDISALYNPSVSGAVVTWTRGQQLRLGSLLATAPVVKAPYSASVKRGSKANLRFKIADTAVKQVTATIAVVNSKGKTVKTINAGKCTCNTTLTRSFTCTLAAGRYTFKVTALDWCMNQASASNRLTVN